MTPAANTIGSSPSLPTLAAIQRRRRELLAFQAWQRPAPAIAPPGESLAAEESEDSCLAQEPHPAEDPEPSPALPSQAIGPPTLADPALYGLAGLAVRTLAPHTEAAPAAILLQFLAAFGNLVGPAPHCIVDRGIHPSRPQSLRSLGRRIEQGPKRNKLAPALQPLRRSR